MTKYGPQMVKPIVRMLLAIGFTVPIILVLGPVMVGIAGAIGFLGSAIASFVMGLIGVVFFVVAKQTHKGQEDIATMLPTIALTSITLTLLATFWPILALSFEINTIAAAMMTLAVIYFAEESARYII